MEQSPGPRDAVLSCLFIMIGGFSGSALRFLADGCFGSLSGTLLVNFLGSAGMGIFMYESIYTGRFGRHARMLIGTGFFGSFTTFSALAIIAYGLLPVVAAGYLILAIVSGLLGIFLGRAAVSVRRLA
jgi:CrcB protein